jgi:hypothetical protein
MKKNITVIDAINSSTKLALINLNFLKWNLSYQPHPISHFMLTTLLELYLMGNKIPLFSKFQRIIDSEQYELAIIFRDCFNAIGINEEFKAWQQNFQI